MSAPDKHAQTEIDQHSGQATTGHEWDGIKELDTPLPRWWLYVFYASILASVVYWVMMPAWPGLPGMSAAADHTRGVRNHSDRVLLEQDLKALQDSRAGGFSLLSKTSYEEILADPNKLEFAQAAGESVFGHRCRTCHGAAGIGAKGYPSLADDVWIWGGTFADIEQTLKFGIRSEHPDTRFSQMPAYGRDGLLSQKDIADVTEHVISLSADKTGAAFDAAAAKRGAVTFEAQCAACHGPTGLGDRTQGAPSLRDDVWVYGGSREEINTQIQSGRGGVMPSWGDRLSPETIRALTIYVYGLGGGEKTPPAVPAPAVDAPPAAPPG